MISSKKHLKLIFIISTVLIAILLFAQSIRAQTSDDDDDVQVSAALEQIEGLEEYNFIAQIEQTLVPRAIPLNIGATEERVDSQLTAEVRNNYTKFVWQFEADASTPPITLEQDGGQFFLINGEERTKIQNPLAGFTHSSDFSDYLKSAQNFRPSETTHSNYQVYDFDIDGEELTRLLQIELSKELSQEQRAMFSANTTYLKKMSGKGLLYIDGEGLPRRQKMTINMPEANERYDIRTNLIIDYQYKVPSEGVSLPSQFETEISNLQNAAAPASAVSSGVISEVENRYTTEWLFTIGLILLASILITIIAVRFRRRFQIIVPLSLVGVMFATPILQPIAATHTFNIAEASTPPTLHEALGLEDEVEEEIALDPEVEAELPLSVPNGQSSQLNATACGTGEHAEDLDGDGLSDFVERCLGTSEYSIDTDGDGLTDTLEVNGFVFTDTLNITHTIYTNPLEVDSNQDGLTDGSEWASPGEALDIDPDGDNLPNPWDPDNDGDLIPDEQDLDPFAVTDFQPSFSLVADRTGDNFTGFQYIDIQVQPQDLDHFRLSTTALDWPLDYTGTLQAHDPANLGELTFVPQLKITTNRVPYEHLQSDYNILVTQNRSKIEMFLPLYPDSDGGQITGFSSRVVYDLAQFTTLNWSKVEFVWTAVMENSTGVGTQTRVTPVAIYTEPSFRLTGLQLSKHSSQDIAIIGTPNQQTDHRQIANTVFGIGTAFLENGAFSFNDLVTRLDTDSTPISQTWGVPAADIEVSSYQASHPDQIIGGFFGVPGRVDTFLTSQNYDLNSLATIIIATQGASGLESLEGFSDLSTSNFTFNLGNISTVTMRGVALNHYEYDASENGWSTISAEDALPDLLGYYDDQTIEAVQTNLAQTYPLIDLGDLASIMSGFYLSWSNFAASIVAVDGIDLTEQPNADELAAEFINLPGVTDFATYLIEAQRLGKPGLGTVFDSPQTFAEYQASVRSFITGPLLSAGKVTYKVTNLALRLSNRADGATSLGGATWNRIRYAQSKEVRAQIQLLKKGRRSAKFEQYAKMVESRRALAQGKNIRAIAQASGLKKIKKILIAYGAKFAKAFSTIFQVAFLTWSLIEIWKTFKQFESPYDFEKNFARDVAITSTIIQSALAIATIVSVTIFSSVLAGAGTFALSVGLVLAVIDLLGLIVQAVFPEAEIGDSLVATAFAKLFAGDVQLKTELRGVNFEGTDIDFNGTGFAIAGSTLTVRDRYTGRIEGFQYRDRLEKADTHAYFTAGAGPNINYATSDTRDDWRRCLYSGSSKYCTNDLEARFTFQNAGLDQEIRFQYKIDADLEYTKYIFGGVRKVEKTEELLLPDDLPDQKDKWDFVTINIDVLPATLDELLVWSELENIDKDADGVPDTTEIAAQSAYSLSDLDNDTLSEPFDWDSDNDGLSDGFEQATANSLHALWYKADSDGDGLDDRAEFNLELSANKADTDNDGLSDGQEVFHYNGSTWTGGGWFIDILGTQYWTFTDPEVNDYDNDNIFDASEKVNGTSPYAYNIAPAMRLAGAPSIDNVIEGIYVRSGDVLSATLDLHNIGTGPITTTLEMCFPAAVSNINVVTGGDRQPVIQTSGNCREWDFSGNPLQLFQSFQVTMTAEATGTTISDTIDAVLPYTLNGALMPISQTIPYVQDNTAPEIFISDPVSNTILTSDFYVMGGNAVDDHSFIDRVEIIVDSGTYTATLTDAQWGYTWELPEEGDITLTAIAYDVVGNASVADTVEVVVDTLPPMITVNLAEGTTIAANKALSTTFQLDGTVSDNKAGIERVQLRYNDGPWRTIWDDANAPLAANWSGLWEIPTVETAQGKHNLELRAYDVYGNIGGITRTVFIDVLPPTNDLTNRAFIQETPRHVPAGPLDILGIASDAGNNPLPTDPAELEGTLNSIEDATVWLQVDNLTENDAGATVNWIGDINGDRLGDLAVGLPAANNGTGRVVVVTGSPGDWPVPKTGGLEFLESHSPSYVGTTGAAIGSIIKPAGDVNGNGIDDYMIGDPINDRIILILGTANTTISNNELNGDSSMEVVIESTADGESLSGLTANQLATAGDITNDGLSDILVSFTGITNTVYLLAGEAPFNFYQPANLRAAFKLDTGTSGASVAGIGDVNGDFVDDFAIAFGNIVYLFSGGGGWIAGGLTTLTTSDAIATFATADVLPTIALTGDMNGDNIDDFAFTNGSTPTVVFGNGSNNFTTQNLSNAVALSGFLSGVGDVDKDGRGDLLIGNADDNAFLFLGADLYTIAATIEGVDSAANAPFVAGADLVGDGSSDLALVPTAAVAAALGYDGFGSTIDAPFIPRDALPLVNPNVAPVGSPPPNAQLPGDVVVAPAGGDFTSIQAAIDSGATRVLIEPGIYAEAIALISDVTIIGSGADRTILTVPSGITNTVLITAVGVSNASLFNLTLLGEGDGIAFSVVNGSTNIGLQRTAIQGFETAVTVDGSSTTLVLQNNTIVGNVDGFEATNNAGVDVRNTIFAYNSGTALEYDPTTVLELHQYNLFFANGTDLIPNSPGGGELFSDPLFNNFASGDFRVAPFSPVIDGGAPGSPVPPGAGDGADIGHLEQSAVGFFIDDDYCSACANDGLIWGVNAFNVIQDGVDAALADLDSIELTEPISFTVGVNEGVYTETVVISGSINLIGRSPDTTAILGNGGPSVTFNAAVDAGVSGFTLMGGSNTKIGVLLKGGSNTVDISTNLIKNNSVGISVTERATGLATFNTIISNTTGIEVARGAIFNTETVTETDNADNVINSYQIRILAENCTSLILCEERGFVWLDTARNIISGNSNGLVANGKSVIFSDNNLLFNGIDYTNVISGLNEIIGQDPLLNGPNGYLTVNSPALDAVVANVPAPPGGGIAADIGWHELLAAPLSVFMGQPDRSIATESIGVGQVEYAIVEVADPASEITATLPVTWETAILDNPGETLTYWRATAAGTTDGSFYRVYSRATDLLGNTEVEEGDWFDGAFYVDGSAPVVTFTIGTAPFNSTFNFPSTWRILTAEVSDYIGSSFDVADIYFIINGERVEGEWRIDDWEPDGSTPHVFYYLLRNTTGSFQNYTIDAVVIDGAGNQTIQTDSIGVTGGASQALNEDILPPNAVTITAPYAGQFVTDTVTVDVTTGDFAGYYCQFEIPPCETADSGVQGVEVSFDGGRTWESMTFVDFDGDNVYGLYTYTGWSPPARKDATTIPVRVRATDYFGLSTTSIVTISIDTESPRLIGTYSANKRPGSYLEEIEPVIVSLPPVVDGSGFTSLASFTRDENNEPVTILPESGSSISLTPSERNFLNAPIGVTDEFLNFTGEYLGTWIGGGNNIQSIIMDGVLDLELGEWMTETERLDDDFRSGRQQTLWATWDFEGAYIGYQGASWGPDGQLWAYFDAQAGVGTNQPISGTATLPFDADRALQAVDANTGYYWTYNDALGVWERDPDVFYTTPDIDFDFREYGHDPASGTTEMHKFDILESNEQTINWDTHRMVVYGLDNNLGVFSAFPTANTLDGNFQYFYEWTNVVQVSDLLKLPIAARQPAVNLVMSSDPEANGQVTGNDSITYIAELTNIDTDVVENLELLLSASSGLTYQTVTGSASFDCSAGDSCTITVPTLPVDGSTRITVTATTTSDLTSIGSVTTTTLLEADLPLPASDLIIRHSVDTTPPKVEIRLNPGSAIGVGNQSVFGTADDEDSGIALVEVSVDGVNWIAASGTTFWSADIVAPNQSTWNLFARATDHVGITSVIVTETLVSDTIPPLLTPDAIPELIGANSFRFGGTSEDPSPVGGAVQLIEVQFDDPTSGWLIARLAPAGATTFWSFQWALPGEDGIIHNVRFRATDYGGNTTVTSFESFVVDSVSPEITVTSNTTQAPAAGPTLVGTIADAHSINSLTVTLYPAVGDPIEEDLTVVNGSWSYSSGQPIGEYSAILQATDDAGNRRIVGPFAVTISGNFNMTPTVNAGADVTVTTPATVTLNATVIDDGLPSATVTTLWTQVSGPGTVTFANSHASSTTASFSTAGVYVLRLTATDGELSASDDIQITVSPEVVEGSAEITIVQETVSSNNRVNFRYSGDLGEFRLDNPTSDDGDAYSKSETFTVSPGTHQMTQHEFGTWNLIDVSCTTDNHVIELDQQRLSVALDDGDDVTCTFTNERASFINARKINDINGNGRKDNGEPVLSGWTIEVYDSNGDLYASDVTNNKGRVSIKAKAGDYTVCEVLQVGWTTIRPAPLHSTLNQPCYEVSLTPKRVAWMRFFNSEVTARSAEFDNQDEDVIYTDLPESTEGGGIVDPLIDPFDGSEVIIYLQEIFLPFINKSE